MISPNDQISETVRARRTTAALVSDLEMLGIFEDEAEEEGDGVTDALSTMLRLLGEESEAASWLMEARSRIEPVEPCDEEW